MELWETVRAGVAMFFGILLIAAFFHFLPSLIKWLFADIVDFFKLRRIKR